MLEDYFFIYTNTLLNASVYESFEYFGVFPFPLLVYLYVLKRLDNIL